MSDYSEYDYYDFEIQERFYSSEDMPLNPVNPTALATRVISQLKTYKDIVVPGKSSIMFADLCKGFNQCIEDNKNNTTSKTYVFSPKTGSAKSVTAKMYVAMLEKESSIIIVPTIKDALTFCKDINDWSGNNTYARCYYFPSGENPKKPNRVEKKDLCKYRCIVATHNMFIKENNNSSHGLFQDYKGSKRDLVIVDERIGLHNRYKITKAVVEDLIQIFETLVPYIPKVDIQKEIEILKQVVEVFSEIRKSTRQANILIGKEMRGELNIPVCNFIKLLSIIQDDNIKISRLSRAAKKIHSDSDEEDLRKDIDEHLSSIEYITSNSFSFHQEGLKLILMSTENILSKFGSHVVLDATATVNEIYKTIAWLHPKTFKHIETEDPRIYKNFTIYKAKGYPQGASSIFKGVDEKIVQERVKEYLETASDLVPHKDDKLLIVCHKDFREKLEKKNINKKIVFTNWGNHVGKNEWSDCNKVLVIGWFQLAPSEYYANYINAVGELEYANTLIDDTTITEYTHTQLADDLVQAVMRGSARNTVFSDGNCAKCEAYIYYPDNEKGRKVMELFEAEFTQVIVKEWEPVIQNYSKKTPKSELNIKTIMTYLSNASKTVSSVTQAKIVKEIDLSKATVSETITSNKCKERFDEAGYTLEIGGKGRANTIYLK